MKKKIIILLVIMALLVGILSGCTETTTTNEAPHASFGYPLGGAQGITVNVEFTFADESTDDVGIESWFWDFGDGTNSTDQNPTHTYTEVGDYEVTLTVTDAEGETDSDTQIITITYKAPIVSFIYDPDTNITVNTTISFTPSVDLGDANISSYLWNFGDGTNSTDVNPTKMFTTADVYTVTVTVTDENEMTSIETADITVIEETV